MLMRLRFSLLWGGGGRERLAQNWDNKKGKRKKNWHSSALQQVFFCELPTVWGVFKTEVVK